VDGGCRVCARGDRPHRTREFPAGDRQGEKGRRERRYLHRGIARRAFERRFSLADHIKVVGANLENGMLHVDLAREVPEAAKPRKIAIGTGQPEQPQAIEKKAA